MQGYPNCIGDHQQAVEPWGVDAQFDIDDHVAVQVGHLAQSLLGEVGVQAGVADALPDSPAPGDDVLGYWI